MCFALSLAPVHTPSEHEATTSDLRSACNSRRRRCVRGAAAVPYSAHEVVRMFREADADGSGGLDMEEFCVGMGQLFGSVNVEDLKILHMKIDANCDGTVDIVELLNFLLTQRTGSEGLDYKNQTFPRPIKIIPVDHYESIVGLLFRPSVDDREPDGDSEFTTGQTRTYQKGQYLSISSDGRFNFWTDSFDASYTIPLYIKSKTTLPFSQEKKMRVNDMVYLRELKQVAISSTDRELFFYNCKELPELLAISHSLIVEESIVNAMNYQSNGTKAVFSFGDTEGYLYVFISYKIQANGLFCPKAYERISLREYPTVYVSALLENPSGDFLCVKVAIFNDTCSQIQYFPTLDSFAICGSFCKTMTLVALHKSCKTKVSKKVFKSRGVYGFFACVEYSPSAERLVTGGTDGLLRLWLPDQTVSYAPPLTGHVKPITHILFNDKDKIFVSLSEDRNVRVWSENAWLCIQSFYVRGMGLAPISRVFYNTHNNELVLANSNIGKCLGRGTDVFKNMLTSHDKPLCSALYHSLFKQVISVCQDGVVTVWDILTGVAIMQFKVTQDQHVGLTAMSFDKTGRRLITVSQDRKVRLWNFNDGTELGVHPVTVPKEVTGSVCINNRLFVSGRNCKIIFDLDMERYDSRFLEHYYLDDISSMDLHENTLITASSNGNIVIWDADTLEALYWLNVTKSPKTHIAGKSAQGPTGSLAVEEKPKPVRDTGRIPLHKKSPALTEKKTGVTISPLIICLRTRAVKVDTATLLTSAEGYIYAWSVISKGGLLGKFRAVNVEGAVIATMSTDVDEQILLTGDSTGRIYLWDIQRFGFRKWADKGPFEDINGWRVSICPPPLLGSWQSHLTRVVSVICDTACKNIITAGLDCNVRLWTNAGRCLGLSGRDRWRLNNRCQPACFL
ncbi:WD repeat-containing protein on Y chromosome-like [Xiphias gladius]|uniref:WD repeat-containing protein on Y chromosome-like n=1 Tax=Xiphias gladius TaxID=8245 RepID=UPI001A98E54D|nr:WD repeat-containing protein on Y chromosome-like [Xiphias gladius]